MTSTSPRSAYTAFAIAIKSSRSRSISSSLLPRIGCEINKRTIGSFGAAGSSAAVSSSQQERSQSLSQQQFSAAASPFTPPTAVCSRKASSSQILFLIRSMQISSPSFSS